MMKMEKVEKSSSAVLKFERDSSFHFAKYQRALAKGKYLDSLVAIRTALSKNSSKVEYRIALAELYTELNHYEESNFLFFKLIDEGKDHDGLCLFGLACNFFGMQDWTKASECFEKYLDEYPNGEYVADAEDFIEIIEESELESEEYFSDLPSNLVEIAERGKALLDRGEYKKAVKLLSDAYEKSPESTFLRNNLSLAYFCSDETERAVELSRSVLREYPGNIHTVCNLILFLTASMKQEHKEEVEELVEYLSTLTPYDIEEKIKVAVTYCELGDHAGVYSAVRDLMQDKPYDVRTIFLLGASAANLGRLGEALSCFMNILKIDPGNSIASYYKLAVQKARENDEPTDFQYVYQVPPEEVRARMAYLNACVQEGVDILKVRWSTDEHFKNMLIWGLTLSDPLIKRAILELISNFEESNAADILKRFLLSRIEPDDLKNDVFIMLKRRGEPQPYMAYIQGKIAEVRVGMYGSGQAELTPSNHAVMRQIIEFARVLEDKRFLPQAIEVLERYIKSFKKPPIMRAHKAWACAVIYLTLLGDEEEEVPDLSDICKELDVAESSVQRCLKLLFEAFE